jgi:TPR repeat protein
MKQVLPAVLWVLGCGGRAPEPVPVASPPPPPPIHAVVPVDAAVASTPVDAMPPPSEWFVQIADDAVSPFESGLTILTRDNAVVVLVAIGSIVSSEWIRLDGARWSRELASEGVASGAAFDARGERWLLAIGKDDVLRLHHGATTEVIGTDYNEHGDDRAQVAIDGAGAAHVCISRERQLVDKRGANDRLDYAKKVGKVWKIERLPAASGDCTIVVGDDGTVTIGTNDGVVTGRSGAWKTESLGGNTIVLRGAGGTSAAVTHVQNGREAWISRRGDGGWQRTPLLTNTNGTISRLAAAIDGAGKVHAAFEVRTGGTHSQIRYVREGATVDSLILDGFDASQGIVLAVDGQNRPHVAVAPRFSQRAFGSLLYARLRTPADPPADFARDVAGQIAACARLARDELGAEPAMTEGDFRRTARVCAPLKTSSQPLFDLEQRCTQGSADACLVAAAIANKPKKALTLMELTTDRCASRKPGCTTTSTSSEESELGWFLPTADLDVALAERAIDRACKLGDPTACFYQLWGTKPASFGVLAGHCTATLPIACAAALAQLPQTLGDAERKQLSEIRGALEGACATSTRTSACVALAFMKERGLGGPARPVDALKHHLRACGLYSPMSCIRLLVGPLGRPAAPKNLDADRIADLLAEHCSRRNQDACMAHAAAYQRGWAVPRDRDKAKQILVDACNDQRMLAACKQVGIKAPAAED